MDGWMDGWMDGLYVYLQFVCLNEFIILPVYIYIKITFC